MALTIGPLWSCSEGKLTNSSSVRLNYIRDIEYNIFYVSDYISHRHESIWPGPVYGPCFYEFRSVITLTSRSTLTLTYGTFTGIIYMITLITYLSLYFMIFMIYNKIDKHIYVLPLISALCKKCQYCDRPFISSVMK